MAHSQAIGLDIANGQGPPPRSPRSSASTWGSRSARRGSPPLSRNAADAVRRARELAEDRGDATVSPVHLLLGILAQPDCRAGSLLERFEIGPARLASHLCKLLPTSGPEMTSEHRTPELSDGVRNSMAVAAAEAASMDSALGSGHLLLGILADPQSIVAVMLRDHGLTAEGIRAGLRGRYAQGKGGTRP